MTRHSHYHRGNSTQDLSEENCTWNRWLSSRHASASSGVCFFCKSGVLEGTTNPAQVQDYRLDRGPLSPAGQDLDPRATSVSTDHVCHGEVHVLGGSTCQAIYKMDRARQTTSLLILLHRPQMCKRSTQWPIITDRTLFYYCLYACAGNGTQTSLTLGKQPTTDLYPHTL